jgi:hypothetical protein
MTYACAALEFTTGTHLLKLQRLQYKFLHNTRKLIKRTRVRELHMSSHVSYIYDCIRKVCKQQEGVIQNQKNSNVRYIEKG